MRTTLTFLFGLLGLAQIACVEKVSEMNTQSEPPDVGQPLPVDALMAVDAAPLDQSLIDLSLTDAARPDAEIAIDASVALGPYERRVDGLPLIYDLSGAPTAHVNQLIETALRGLGLDENTGPNARDRVFVGRRYMVWLDETGFYGKANGLWSLNGDPENLDFQIKDGDRPVNAFIVGENGNGEWPGGYMGSEHLKFTSRVPDTDDDESCADTFCAYYGHAEAPQYTEQVVSPWRICNSASPSFDDRFEPLSVEVSEESLIIWYEGPLTKQADFGSHRLGNFCGADYLFPDGQRRPVFLQVGYKLSANEDWIDRRFRLRNLANNPALDIDFGLIGGFVFTRWPEPHVRKELNRYVYLSERDLFLTWGENAIELRGEQWTELPTEAPATDVELIFARQGITLSPEADFLPGRTFSIEHDDPVNNPDTGFCLCSGHGGIEMGGSLLMGSLEPGALSPIAKRRLSISNGAD